MRWPHGVTAFDDGLTTVRLVLCSVRRWHSSARPHVSDRLRKLIEHELDINHRSQTNDGGPSAANRVPAPAMHFRLRHVERFIRAHRFPDWRTAIDRRAHGAVLHAEHVLSIPAMPAVSSYADFA